MGSFRVGSSWGKVCALLVVAATTAATVGCSKKQEAEAEKAQADKKDEGDRYANGKRLAAALKKWSKLWSDMPDLPSCEPLLKDAADLELCKAAVNAQTVMRAADKHEPEAVLIHDAADVMFTTHLAWDKLNAAYEKLEAERTAPAPSASAAPAKTPSKAPPPASSAHAKAKPAASGAAPSASAAASAAPAAPDKPAEPAADPALQVKAIYARVNREARRYLLQYLQFGPLPTRNLAFTEIETVAKRSEAWPQLGHTLREAAVVENDRDLRGKIKALAANVSQRGADDKE